jgi:DNA-binding beta-propeller fold protein YncE
VTNSGSGDDSVARIDPETNRVAGRSVRTIASPQSLAVGGGWLWVANHEAGTVTRIEQASGKLAANIPVPSEPHGSPTARVRPGWATGTTTPSPGSTQRRTVSSGRRSRSGSAPATWWSALAASGSPATTAWTPRPEDVVVVRIDPQTNRAVETIAVGGHPIDVAATEDAIWVSVADPGTVLRIAGR